MLESENVWSDTAPFPVGTGDLPADRIYARHRTSQDRSAPGSLEASAGCVSSIVTNFLSAPACVASLRTSK